MRVIQGHARSLDLPPRTADVCCPESGHLSMATSHTTQGRPGNPIRAWFSRHATALFVGGFGLAFAIAGIVILTVALPAARARAGAAAGLPVVTVAGAREQPAGTRVLLEARIAADAATPYGQFVAFRRQEFRGWKEENGRRTE